MSKVFRVVTGYQAAYAHLNNGALDSISCKKMDIYRCAVTVGNPTFISWRAIRSHGLLATLCTSIIDKCSIVASNVETHGNILRRGGIYDHHVSDVKRQVSYSLGMAFAKFHSEKLLGIRNLIHLEFLKKLNAVTFVQQPLNNRPQEPDLVGQSTDGNWHIFEAKGSSFRSNVSPQIAAGKLQASQIATIHAQLPATRTVAGTYIGRDQIVTYLEDPSDSGTSTISFEQDKFNHAYYAPFLLPQQSDSFKAVDRLIDGIQVRMFEIKGSAGTTSIGVMSEVYEALNTKQTTELASSLPKESLLDRKSDKFSFGPDGFVVGFISDK